MHNTSLEASTSQRVISYRTFSLDMRAMRNSPERGGRQHAMKVPAALPAACYAKPLGSPPSQGSMNVVRQATRVPRILNRSFRRIARLHSLHGRMIMGNPQSFYGKHLAN